MFSYTVRCEFADDSVAQEWIRWMQKDHLGDVCEAGATDAEVVVLDRQPHEASRALTTAEVRYHFPSRAAFEQYEREHAPRLREEGLRRFPLERGLKYTRLTGEVAACYCRVS